MSKEAEDTLEFTTIHRSLNRPNLFLGGDREMVMFSGLIAATLIFCVLEFKAVAAGVLLWMFALFVLRRMAKADPLLRKVYMRNLTYRNHYPPRPSPYRVIREVANKRRMGNPWKR